MNSASLVRSPKGNKRKERRAGGLSPPRQLQIEQTGAGSTTACTSPRTRWRSSRARCRSGPSFLASFEARVCVSASACLLCVSALRGCLGREIKPHSVLRPLRTPGRPRAGAVARVPFGRCHIHALTWTSASRFGSVRGERQARVPHVVCACVVSCCQRVLCVFCAFCVFFAFLLVFAIFSARQRFYV